MINQELELRSRAIYKSIFTFNATKTNRLFSILFVVQWLILVTIAVALTPTTWHGPESRIHPHVFAAFFLGGGMTVFVYLLGRYQAHQTSTRYLVAICQLCMSVLFIHVTGGRIESHFHIFGSLAFLAFYRDPKVLLLASAFTAADHLLRGEFFSMSIYGVADAGSWRWLEHAAWVIFEDVFLIYSCFMSNQHMREISQRQAILELSNLAVETQVKLRTQELEESLKTIEQQRMVALESSKMAALGEMAAGIAHEINNPLAAIKISSEQLEDVLSDAEIDTEYAKSVAHDISSLTTRISTIIRSLRNFGRDGASDPLVSYPVKSIIDETVIMCSEKFKSRSVDLRIDPFDPEITLACRPVQISQVILNLLHNALDAVEHLDERWVQISVFIFDNSLRMTITDSGKGIPEELRDKILRPFFTTKDVGKGTGLGLSVSRGIIEAHNGEFRLETAAMNTQFSLFFKERVRDAKAA